MPRVFIPFSDFRPDYGHFLNDGLVDMRGAIPGVDRYLPLPAMAIRSNTLGTSTNATNRCHVNLNPPSGSAPQIYVLNGSSVRVVDTGAGPPWTVSTLTHSGTGSVGTSADSGDIFGFGQHEIFTQGHSNLPKIRLSGAGNLLDLCTTPAGANAPKPKFGCVLGERILIANIGNTVAAGVGTPDPDPELVWWSATRNARVFTTAAADPSVRSGYKALRDDNGAIRGVAGDKEYALIFKRRAIYRMDIGGEFGFTFRVIPQSYGCISHLSICRLGNDVYFWSDAGPCVYRSNQVIPLGLDRMNAFLVDSIPSAFSPAWGSFLGVAADPVRRTVSWLYTYLPQDSVAHRCRLLTYSVPSDSFGLTFDIELGLAGNWYASDGSARTASPSILFGGFPYGVERSFSQMLMLVDEFESTNQVLVCSFNGDDHWWGDDTSFTTGFLALGGERSVVVERVRPVIRTAAASQMGDAEVAVYAKSKPWDDPRIVPGGPFRLSTHSDVRGFVTIPRAEQAQFQQFQLTIPWRSVVSSTARFASDLLEIEGVEVEFSIGTGKL